MQFWRCELNYDPDIRLSPGPFFVTRKGSTTIIYHGGFQRWKSVRISVLELRWNWRWQIRCRGEVFGQQVFGDLASEKSTYLVFKGLSGSMIIGDAVNANVHVSRKEAGSYAMQVADIKNEWEVHLVALGPPGQILNVEISFNGAKLISAPSSYQTWTEGVLSIGGFVRYKWGDWLHQSSEKLPVAAILTCVCCVGFHNSVLGDLLARDTPIG
jgi:hypothetical protein